MGYWQKESEFGKKVGCFKASLGSLGLIATFWVFRLKASGEATSVLGQTSYPTSTMLWIDMTQYPLLQLGAALKLLFMMQNQSVVTDRILCPAKFPDPVSL